MGFEAKPLKNCNSLLSRITEARVAAGGLGKRERPFVDVNGSMTSFPGIHSADGKGGGEERAARSLAFFSFRFKFFRCALVNPAWGFITPGGSFDDMMTPCEVMVFYLTGTVTN